MALGRKTGGKQKGTPNKKTVIRLEREDIERQVRAEHEAARRRDRKEAKAVLEEYMGAFHAIAATFQNSLVAALQAKTKPLPADLEGFEKWGGLTVSTARELAKYQSPTFKAISVMAPAPPGPEIPQAANSGDKVVTLDDPVALSRFYQRTMKQVR